jgi:hypothetical protein
VTDDVDFDALGRQYREAKTSIGAHRVKQARTEVAYNETLRRHGGDRSAPAVITAQATVDQAVADVEWCKAVTVAAGEAIKGRSLEDVVAMNDENRAQYGPAALREQTLRAMPQGSP